MKLFQIFGKGKVIINLVIILMDKKKETKKEKKNLRTQLPLVSANPLKLSLLSLYYQHYN